MKNLRLIKSFSILCASAVLIYLAVANALYGQSVKEKQPIRISPAGVYALMRERAEENKPWTEPSPLPGNVNRKIEKPFQVTVK